jgi:hypothetical protein
VSLTVRWPSTVTSFTQVRGTITPTVVGKEGFTVAASSATSSEGFESIIQTIEGLPTGSYQFKLEFLDSLGNPVGLSYREALNVYKDMTSTKTYQVPAVVFPIETPVISMDGSYQVSITCATDAVTIYYTTNGGEPGTSSPVYSAPFTITQNTTVKAVAVREDRLSSAIAEAYYEVPAAAPTFSLPAATYDEPQTVTLSTTAGATIRYTLGESDPTAGSTEYTQALQINENTIVKAIATHPNHIASSVASAEYKIQAAAPTFSLAGGSLLGPQTVTLSTTTSGADIYYTLDGSDPTSGTLYIEVIQVPVDVILRAVSKKANMENSPIVEREYVILEKKVATPTFDPVQGTYSEGQSVTISCETPEAAIYYTTNGSTPTEAGLLYSGPVAIIETTTLKAIGILPEDWVDSDVATAVYTLQVVAPSISMASGTYQAPQIVSLSTTTADAVIYYTLDGSDPATSQTRVQYSQGFSIERSLTLKAVAEKTTGWSASTVSSGTYQMFVAAPAFSVPSGTYADAQSVEITSATAGATIHYTTDGSDPTPSSQTYSTAIDVDASMTIKADAVKDGCTDSAIASATYTIEGSSGISVVDLPNHSVAIQLPQGWEDGIVVTGVGATITAEVTPTPAEGTVSYAWYLDGEIAEYGLGMTASTTQNLEFGISGYKVYLSSGPHILTVEVSQGNMKFSDQKIIIASTSGTVGTIYQPVVGEIGMSGGYIFYDKGDYSDGWRYLEAAPAGWSGATVDPGYMFGYYRTTSTGTNLVVGTGTAVGTGKANTTVLTATMGSTAYSSDRGTEKAVYAAKICEDYTGGGYDDWFLPSKDELNLMYQNLMVQGLGGFSDGGYWSSSEGSDGVTWSQYFGNGYQNYSSAYRSNDYVVRPVRAF